MNQAETNEEISVGAESKELLESSNTSSEEDVAPKRERMYKIVQSSNHTIKFVPDDRQIWPQSHLSDKSKPEPSEKSKHKAKHIQDEEPPDSDVNMDLPSDDGDESDNLDEHSRICSSFSPVDANTDNDANIDDDGDDDSEEDGNELQIAPKGHQDQVGVEEMQPDKMIDSDKSRDPMDNEMLWDRDDGKSKPDRKSIDGLDAEESLASSTQLFSSGLQETVESDNKVADKDQQDTKEAPSNGSDNNVCEINTESLGRNRRVRQKNRYLADFHCIDLTKGGRSNRDDYDAAIFQNTTGSAGLNSRSNRSSNSSGAHSKQAATNSNQVVAGALDDGDKVYETKYCRRCSNRTMHDVAGGCQPCILKSIVSKRSKSSSQRSRPAAVKRTQQASEIVESDATNTAGQSSRPPNGKRKAPSNRPTIGASRSRTNVSNESMNEDESINKSTTPSANLESPKSSLLGSMSPDRQHAVGDGNECDEDKGKTSAIEEDHHTIGGSRPESVTSPGQHRSRVKPSSASSPSRDTDGDNGDDSQQVACEEKVKPTTSGDTSNASDISSKFEEPAIDKPAATKTATTSESHNNNFESMVKSEPAQEQVQEPATLQQVNIEAWTPDDVAEFIDRKGFSGEAELFKTQSVDGISLLLMQRTDFTYGLKIKLGPALKIYDQVCKLKREYFRNLPVSQSAN